MTDVVEVEGAAPSTILFVPISRGRSGDIEVDTAKLAEYIYVQCLKEGAKVLVNKGMTKIEKTDTNAIMAKANENLKAMYEGTMVIRGSKAKSDKVPSEVMTLARNMARAIVKGELKKKGFKVSLIKSAQITKAANILLQQRPELIAKAQADYNAQLEQEDESDVTAGIAEDPELVKKAAAAKQAKQLSAKTAGKIAARGRPVQ